MARRLREFRLKGAFRVLSIVATFLTVMIFILVLTDEGIRFHPITVQPSLSLESQSTASDDLNSCSACVSQQEFSSDDSSDQPLCDVWNTNIRDANQKVMGYSLFGENTTLHHYTRYFAAAEDVAKETATVYPGWVVRIYHNLSRISTAEYQYLCQIACRYPHVQLCNVTALARRIPAPDGIDTRLVTFNPSMWRFLPIIDPYVELFISRDIDNVVVPREKAAVDEWLASPRGFHIMRDYHTHLAVILAGMWGAKVHQRRKLLRTIWDKFYSLGQQAERTTDQILLAREAWPLIVKDSLIHDSFHCKQKRMNPFEKGHPFPTERKSGYNWRRQLVFKIKPCPESCRPSNHKDWTFC